MRWGGRACGCVGVGDLFVACVEHCTHDIVVPVLVAMSSSPAEDALAPGDTSMAPVPSEEQDVQGSLYLGESVVSESEYDSAATLSAAKDDQSAAPEEELPAEEPVGSTVLDPTPVEEAYDPLDSTALDPTPVEEAYDSLESPVPAVEGQDPLATTTSTVDPVPDQGGYDLPGTPDPVPDQGAYDLPGTPDPAPTEEAVDPFPAAVEDPEPLAMLDEKAPSEGPPIPTAAGERAIDPPSPEEGDARPPQMARKRKDKPKPQIMLIGPPMSGKKSITERFANEYGVIPLTMDAIYKEVIASGSQDGFELEECMASKRNVSDELAIKLVIDRVKQGDTTACGYCIAGFPRNRAQATAIFDAQIPLKMLVALDVDEAVVKTRSQGRRIDPETKRMYHVDYNPATDEDVLERLEARPEDAEAAIEKTMEIYSDNCENVDEVFFNRGVSDEGEVLIAVNHVQDEDQGLDALWKQIKNVVGAPPVDDEAAAKIQAMVRGRQERQLQKDREEAAKKIQSIQRGRAVRKEVENKQKLNKQVRFDSLINALVAATDVEQLGNEMMNLFPSNDGDYPLKDFIGRVRRWKADPMPEEMLRLQEVMQGDDTLQVLAENDFQRVDGKGKIVFSASEFVDCITNHGGHMQRKKRKEEISKRQRRASVTEFTRRSQEFETMFRECDLDGDGQLSMEEFHNGFAAKAASWGYAGSMDASQSAELDMFKAMDTDMSGMISFEEFSSYMESIQQSWKQETREEAAKVVAVAREKDRANEIEEAIEYSLKMQEDFETVDTGAEDGTYTRYNVPAIVVANTGTQATFVNKKANTMNTAMSTTADMGSVMDEENIDTSTWDSFASQGGEDMATRMLFGEKQEDDANASLWRDDGILLAKIIRRYRPGLKYIFEFYSRTNTATAARATRGVATFEAIACEHSGVSRIMFRRLCADFGLLREDGAKAKKYRRKIDDLCLTAEECLAIFDQHARSLNMVSSVSKGRGVLHQNEFAACLAQLADTLMEPYQEAYPSTWRRVHAIFGRLDFSNILELRKRLRGKTGFGVGDGEPTGHGKTSHRGYKNGFSYELSPRDWPNAPLTPLPRKGRTKEESSAPIFENMISNEREVTQLQLASEFGTGLVDFGDMKSFVDKSSSPDINGTSDEMELMKVEKQDDVNAMLDGLGLTYGLESKLVRGVINLDKGKRRKAALPRRAKQPSKLLMVGGKSSTNGRAKPVPPPRGEKGRARGRNQRVSPQRRRIITTQFDNL